MQRLKLGEIGHFGEVDVTPISLDSDSRCPPGTQCVSAGTVTVKVLVEPPGEHHSYFATSGQPLAVDGGTLVLEEVAPQASPARIPPNHYIFALRYTRTSG